MRHWQNCTLKPISFDGFHRSPTIFQKKKPDLTWSASLHHARTVDRTNQCLKLVSVIRTKTPFIIFQIHYFIIEKLHNDALRSVLRSVWFPSGFMDICSHWTMEMLFPLQYMYHVSRLWLHATGFRISNCLHELYATATAAAPPADRVGDQFNSQTTVTYFLFCFLTVLSKFFFPHSPKACTSINKDNSYVRQIVWNVGLWTVVCVR